MSFSLVLQVQGWLGTSSRNLLGMQLLHGMWPVTCRREPLLRREDPCMTSAQGAWPGRAARPFGQQGGTAQGMCHPKAPTAQGEGEAYTPSRSRHPRAVEAPQEASCPSDTQGPALSAGG